MKTKNQMSQNFKERQDQNNQYPDFLQSGEENQSIVQMVVNEQQVYQLQESLRRLIKFVATIQRSQVLTIPRCVEVYCNNLKDYKMQDDKQVIKIAQRRLHKMLRNHKIKKNWNNEDIKLLIWMLSKRIQMKGLTRFEQLQDYDWKWISQHISGSTMNKCKFRWLNLRKTRLIESKWSQAQSQNLYKLIMLKERNIEINWKDVASQLYILNNEEQKVFRSAKQCREHWACFLNPSLRKGPWQLQQDKKLLQYVLEFEGNKKWSQISKFMMGRTQNALKNRFNLLINRQRKLSGNHAEKRLVKICYNSLVNIEGQRNTFTNVDQNEELPPRVLSKQPQQIVQNNLPDTNNRLSYVVPQVQMNNFVGVIPNSYQSLIGTNQNRPMMNQLNYVGIINVPHIYYAIIFPNQAPK